MTANDFFECILQEVLPSDIDLLGIVTVSVVLHDFLTEDTEKLSTNFKGIDPGYVADEFLIDDVRNFCEGHVSNYAL